MTTHGDTHGDMVFVRVVKHLEREIGDSEDRDGNPLMTHSQAPVLPPPCYSLSSAGNFWAGQLALHAKAHTRGRGKSNDGWAEPQEQPSGCTDGD